MIHSFGQFVLLFRPKAELSREYRVQIIFSKIFVKITNNYLKNPKEYVIIAI